MKEQDIQGESMTKAYIGWEGKSRKEGMNADWGQQVWILYQRRKSGFYHLDKGKWTKVSKCGVDNIDHSTPLWRIDYIEEIMKRVINWKSFSWVEVVEIQSKQLVWDVVRTSSWHHLKICPISRRMNSKWEKKRNQG